MRSSTTNGLGQKGRAHGLDIVDSSLRHWSSLHSPKPLTWAVDHQLQELARFRMDSPIPRSTMPKLESQSGSCIFHFTTSSLLWLMRHLLLHFSHPPIQRQIFLPQICLRFLYQRNKPVSLWGFQKTEGPIPPFEIPVRWPCSNCGQIEKRSTGRDPTLPSALPWS